MKTLLLFLVLSTNLLGDIMSPSQSIIPFMFFMKNSTVYSEYGAKKELEYKTANSDSVLQYYAYYIQDHPDIPVFEVKAYASFDETNPEAISSKRAEQIMQDLISLGVPSNRLFARGYGDSKLFIPKEDFEDMSDYEISLAHDQNRRATISPYTPQ